MNKTLLMQLLNKGDYIAIERGRLIIKAASGTSVPPNWLDVHGGELVQEILLLSGMDGYIYDSFATGNYGKRKCAGVNLQFKSVLSDRDAYCIYNADLKRKRSSKKGKSGDKLPGRQFRPPKAGAFYSFWSMTGLVLPRQVSEFHDYMGNLKGLVFLLPVIDSERADKDSIAMCEITHKQIEKAALAHEVPVKSQLTPSYDPVKPQLRVPVKETPQSLTPRDIQPIPATGNIYYGTTVIRESGYTGEQLQPLPPVINPVENQSNDDWLADLSSTPKNSFNASG